MLVTQSCDFRCLGGNLNACKGWLHSSCSWCYLNVYMCLAPVNLSCLLGWHNALKKSDGCPIYENDSYRLCVSADLSSAARNICTCIMHVFLQPAPPDDEENLPLWNVLKYIFHLIIKKCWCKEICCDPTFGFISHSTICLIVKTHKITQYKATFFKVDRLKTALIFNHIHREYLASQ